MAEPLDVIAYGPDEVVERRSATVEEARAMVDRFPVVWLNVASVADPALVERVGKAFGLHPLAIEDVGRTHQRPKVEPYDSHVYIVVRMLQLRPNPEDPDAEPQVHSEQLSIFLGRGWLITFQETEGDVFDGVRQRIRVAGSNLRHKAADHLAYRLVDAIVDSLFPVLKSVGDRLEDLEEALGEKPNADVRKALQEAKRDLVALRRVLWPQRDALHALERLPSPLIAEETRTFLRDPLDHAMRAVDLVESYREIAADLRDLYLAEINTRSAEVMRVLTLVATIFIPLTFIAGVYGMNFEHMPELDWRFGYPAVLFGMFALGGGMFLAFWRKGWV